MMDVFKVLAAGLYTTVQDEGRYGYQKYGVPPTGALDQFAYRIANILVGNPEKAAVLETTVIGPKLEVLGVTDVAITGADIAITVNDQPVENWSVFRVKPGDVLNLGRARSGCRGYLAVTGGIDVPLVMGSRSSYIGARIGGHQGRILAKGDVLKRGPGGKSLGRFCHLQKELVPLYSSDIVLRAVPGPQDDYFDQGLDAFFESGFTVSPSSNRMGYRLQGPQILHKKGVPESIISEPSLPGGVQIPPDRQPIVLLVEQTVGGYEKIATVISADIFRIAQAKPGDKIRFRRVTLEEAYQAFREQRKILEQIRNIPSEG